MSGHARTAVERYLNLSESSLKKVGTPCVGDHQISDEDFLIKGDSEKMHLELCLLVYALPATIDQTPYGS